MGVVRFVRSFRFLVSCFLFLLAEENLGQMCIILGLCIGFVLVVYAPRRALTVLIWHYSLVILESCGYTLCRS